MNHLTREIAPISAAAWKQIDEEARERLTPHLAARRVVDVAGPHGWDYSSTNLGRVRTVERTGEGAALVRQRQVLPLIELRVPFTVARDELDSADRGATDLAFDDLDRAAHDIAVLENKAVFHGWDEVGFTGLGAATATALGTDVQNYSHAVAKAVDVLREAGIKGPYALAIGPRGHRAIMESTEGGGLLVLDHLRRILGGGKVVRAPGVDGAVVASLDGGHFVLELGQDIAVGYSHHDADTVTLYLEESFSFRVLEPDAAVGLTG
ncbi:family 1 encapsulin nanocompartment shell protein [Umezawaea sp. Da 62-37]|uniref:family 1 encapsulin nanocompartment shell protein n=1 Tax=Umezawaea sp. Da 62-37 TaxID=3075927 RepID=UPI0028F70B49|nr:family 1 encapsulin nanocompartment shell protein [Umezawaea sp. Da 62-37]WNV86196.1 family 1 encapsulin nanocompartment shell protein [Umezawaea sp. Da 62-37]